MAETITLLLDYENVHRVGHGLHGRGREKYACVPEPSLIADKIAARRGTATTVESIRVYRGRPNPRHEPVAASANDKQAAQWARRDGRVRVERRPLAYRNWPDAPPVEKGIDVKLAVDLIYEAMRKDADALVLFSSDTDLLPAIELARKIGTRVEVACWDGSKRLAIPGDDVVCHHLSAADWRAVVRDWTGRV
jgi:hypothetical protein